MDLQILVLPVEIPAIRIVRIQIPVTVLGYVRITMNLVVSPAGIQVIRTVLIQTPVTVPVHVKITMLRPGHPVKILVIRTAQTQTPVMILGTVRGTMKRMAWSALILTQTNVLSPVVVQANAIRSSTCVVERKYAGTQYSGVLTVAPRRVVLT
jgi:hypothetical protein